MEISTSKGKRPLPSPTDHLLKAALRGLMKCHAARASSCLSIAITLHQIKSISLSISNIFPKQSN